MRAYRISRVVVPAGSLWLVSLDQAKDALGIPPDDTSQDGRLGQQIASVSTAINNYCDRVFVVQTYRDQLRNAVGYYGEPLVTRHYPIVQDEAGVPLVAVTENGVALDAAYLEVYPETGAVYRLDAAMSPSAWGVELAVVDYTAGYETIPADVQSAALEWLGARWGNTGRDPGLRSETIPDLITQVYSDSSASAGSMPGGARDLLAPYRIWTV